MKLRHYIALTLTLALSSSFSLAAAADATLDEVIVTATRSPVKLIDYAGSATLIEPGEIQQTGATHHSDLLNRVPGTQFQRNSGQESLTAIRSPVLAGAGSCGSFLFLEDAIPIRPVGFCNVNELFEVNFAQAQSVEVLRGPAGVIYGSSAMHGAVNVISIDPTRAPAGSVALEVGQDGYQRGTGIASFGESERAGVLTANIVHDAGWRDDSTVNEQKFNGAWHEQLGESTLDIHGAFTRLDQDTAGFLVGKDSYRNEALSRTNANPEAYRDAHALRLNATWHLPLNDSLRLDVRPYLRSSRMDFIQHFLPGQPTEVNGQDSYGVIGMLAGDQGKANWVVGADLERADISLLEIQTSPTTGGTAAVNASRPVGRHYDYNVDTEVYALYGRYEIQFGEWHFNAGARGERVKYDYDNRMIDGNTREDGTPCPLNATGCLYARAPDRTDTYNTLTPQIGALWHFADDFTAYATMVRGYRAPDTNELFRLQRQQSLLPPSTERLDSVEVGTRGILFDVNYTLAIFAMRKENMIIRDANGINLNGAKTKHRGIEYSLSWNPLEQLRFGIDGTSAIHRYDFTANIAGGEAIVAGREIDTAPRNLFNARVDWHFMEAVNTELEWQHVGAYSADAANLNFYEGHNLLNLRTSWQINEEWSTALRIANLADRRYADRADFANNSYRYFPGHGRTVYVEARWQVK